MPTLEQIVALNRHHIDETGGFCVDPHNLRNRDSLEWVLDAIRYPLFGFDLYPTLAEKAARLAWTIIHHVFFDGCKRTGMSALEIFVELNSYRLNATDDEIVEVALRVAIANSQDDDAYNGFVQWVRSKIALKTADELP